MDAWSAEHPTVMSSRHTLPLAARSPAQAASLCDLVPILRMAALAERCAGAAEELVWDAILEWLVVAALGRQAVPSLARLRSTMHTARHTGDSVGRRGGVPGTPEARLRALAAAIHELPAEEREAVILLALLGASPVRGAELVATAPGTLVARQMRGLARLIAASRRAAPDAGITARSA
jgi:hypothetical protein